MWWTQWKRTLQHSSMIDIGFSKLSYSRWVCWDTARIPGAWHSTFSIKKNVAWFIEGNQGWIMYIQQSSCCSGYEVIPILCMSLTSSMCTTTGRYPSSTRKSDALYSNREYVHSAQLSDHPPPFNNGLSWCEVGGSNPSLNSLSVHTISIVAVCSSAIEAQRKVSVVHQDAT